MIGQTISHYKILEKLGGGGMGVVYKAQDLKLDRHVALKFLPPDLIRDPEAKARFVQEAKAASALQHNNICTIHDIDQTLDEQLYIVMDCYEGEPLKKKIGRGPMKVEDAIDIATQTASGLAKAHEKGIIHRDIKPANIIITNDGVVKILDFGLAKLAGQSRVTRTGSMVGTAAYMSPEQAQGLEIDHRTDIWSLGVVLYEMLTGKLPFRGEHEAALLYLIVHEEPLALSGSRMDIPRNLAFIISKTLRKDPRQRYETAREFVSELKVALTHGIQLPTQEMAIIVLPFENLSRDPDQEYFSDGLTEEVISDLSAVRSLRVISRSSAMTFKGTKKKIPEIAREVKVQYVLEGSVRKAGNSLRITAQLIEAESDAHIWAEKYSGTLDDVFEIQEKVSRSIVDALKLKLTPEEKQKIAEHPVGNVTAYDCYLKAHREILGFSEASLDRAVQYLHDSLEIIGDNALIYSTMAYVYWQYVNIGIKQEEYIARAEEYVNKALSLDPASPQAHTVLGAILITFRGRQRDGVRHLKIALAANPDDPMPLLQLAVAYLQIIGKLTLAVPLVQRMLRVDPLNSIGHLCEASLVLFRGKYGLALESSRRALQIDPENPVSQFFYSWTLAYDNRIEEALSTIDHMQKGSPDVSAKLGLLLKYGLLKDREKSLQVITPDFQKTCRRHPGWSHYVGVMLSLADARKEALDWLENAVSQGFTNYPALKLDTFLANVRGEERFKKLMKRVKKEWEEFQE